MPYFENRIRRFVSWFFVKIVMAVLRCKEHWQSHKFNVFTKCKATHNDFWRRLVFLFLPTTDNFCQKPHLSSFIFFPSPGKAISVFHFVMIKCGSCHFCKLQLNDLYPGFTFKKYKAAQKYVIYGSVSYFLFLPFVFWFIQIEIERFVYWSFSERIFVGFSTI